MAPDQSSNSPSVGHVTLRYWAAARHAAGVDHDLVETSEPVTLASLVERAVALHPGADRLPGVLHMCSALVDEQPVGRAAPADVLVPVGATVEFLPPFAGG